MITKQQIDKAKLETKYFHGEDRWHEHDDCIRIAFEWLDAQQKLSRNSNAFHLQTKHYIERWAGRYVSMADVEVAAHLHPMITGKYPAFNLSRKLTEPSLRRLNHIEQAFAQPNYQDRHLPVGADGSPYRRSE